MLDITFVTGNAAKAEQLQRYLKLPIEHTKLDLEEIQSLDLEEVVAHKATAAFKLIGSPVLIEDTALTFQALGRLPGPLIKWFLSELGNEGLCKFLDGYQDRTATATVLYGLYDGTRLRTFAGEVEGSIADRPRGVEGFGWNPIFMPKGSDKTWAEMTVAEQRHSSMRRIALEKLEAELSSELR
ncbi:MAG TPA: non-canonical purine NTP pyrophosphatase [Candidatus Saccharimonadales bacterium]|nr:non-canonical purine NTP pyrophosphatase [Candidatus Saccharimonadales bacterium]